MRPALRQLLLGGGGRVDFRTTMPGAATYTRTGAATGLTAAGAVQSFAADAPQRTDRGLLIEPARTNLAISSNGFSTAAWFKNNLTATDDQTTAPDQTSTAAILDEGVATGGHSAFANFTSVASTSYTATVFFKDVDRRYVQLFFGSAGHGSNAFANFDLQTGAVGTVGAAATATILALADGWYQCSMTAPATASSASASAQLALVTSSTAARVESFAGTGKRLYAWGAGVAASAIASSPIITTGSSATRGLPVFTEPVPAGRTKALLTYADASTTLVTGLTPGGTFDVATAVINANKGRFGSSELITREWRS